MQLGVKVFRIRNEQVRAAPFEAARLIAALCERLGSDLPFPTRRQTPSLSPEIGGKGPGDRGPPQPTLNAFLLASIIVLNARKSKGLAPEAVVGAPKVGLGSWAS